jgi:hypothetical protein
VHNVSDVRQIEVNMAELLVPGSSRLEVEITMWLSNVSCEHRAKYKFF